MPETGDRRQVATNLGCSLALTSVFGVGLIGHFIKDGLSWPWVALLSAVLLMGIGALSAAIQRALDAGGGGDDGGSGPTPEPTPEPRSRIRVPSGWPPEGGHR